MSASRIAVACSTPDSTLTWPSRSIPTSRRARSTLFCPTREEAAVRSMTSLASSLLVGAAVGKAFPIPISLAST
jgi:hypothetical protein